MKQLYPNSPSTHRRTRHSPTILPTAEAMLEAFVVFLEVEVAQGDAAQDTVQTYLAKINQFLQWCTQVNLSPALATPEDIKTYRHYLIKDKGLKSATIALSLSVIRRFYEASLTQKLVKENPALGIKPPRQKVDPAERLTYLEEEELRHLLASLPHDHSLKSLRDRCLIGIMALQGPRTVELHRANFSDLVRKGNHWGLRVEGKGQIRTIPLRPDLADLLWQYLQMREAQGEVLTAESPLFLTVGNRFGGNRLSRRGIRWVVDQYLKASELKEVNGRILTAHSLRHTAGTLGLRGGADLRQIQDLLGHQDPKTTALYAHVNDRHAHNPALGIDVEL